MTADHSISQDKEGQALLSIVIPLFNEAGNLTKLYDELITVLPAIKLPWEIIFSDDGSQDSSWEEIELLHAKDHRVKGLRLSRNFGHQYALLAGLSCSRGDAVVSMDADLQHPPEMVPKLVAEWQNGNKIVHTNRLDPENISFAKKITSKLYYKVFSFLSGVKIGSGMADFRLLDRQVLNNVLCFQEEGLFFRGVVQWVGHKNTTLDYACRERFAGASKYTLGKMIKLARTGITSFSTVPLRIGIFIGIITSLLAFGEMVYAIAVKIFTDTATPGWASAVSIVSFLFGILFILLGIVGEYVGSILIEVRRRPRFLITEQVGIQNKIQDYRF
ncbi:MAG: glycosyltransferase family 2 protein [Desulfobacterales bacterium]|nr:glycosyltransferase family 2 protein [Desulfobacterales bacterium]